MGWKNSFLLLIVFFRKFNGKDLPNISHSRQGNQKMYFKITEEEEFESADEHIEKSNATLKLKHNKINASWYLYPLKLYTIVKLSENQRKAKTLETIMKNSE